MNSINMIVALDDLGGFSKNNTIPWSNKNDLKFFKEVTTKNENTVLIMGRVTAYSLKSPLKDRINCVITNNNDHKLELTKKGFDCYNNIDEIINKYKNYTIFLIGGLNIYDWGLLNYNKIDKIYITRMHGDYKCDRYLNNSNLVRKFRKFYNNNYSEIIEEFNYYKNKYNDINLEIWTHKENNEEKKYLELLEEIKNHGHERNTRNGITYSLFGKTLSFSLKNQFPLLTTKKMFLKGIFEELKFFLLGQTDNKILKDKNVNIWNGNTNKEFIEKCGLPYEENTLGPMYGYQWRYFNAKYIDSKTDYTGQGVDQLADVINLIKTDPFSRRILMTSYNPEQAKQGVLYPCHGISIQFYVDEDEVNKKYYLNCLMTQRSGDTFLGIPFNISSYALLVYIICNYINNTGGIFINNDIHGVYGIYPGELLMTFCDVHLYKEHIDAVNTQLSRQPFLFPELEINYDIISFNNSGFGSIGELNYNDIHIKNYKSYESIKAPMIV